jgi:hypothetical protein
MILNRMTDAVILGAVIVRPGRCMPWQQRFLCGNIVADACFKCSGPQPITLPNLMSFCEFTPVLGLVWHPAKQG